MINLFPMQRVKHGFTLVELTVSTLIMSLLALVMMTIFRSNLNVMSWGQKHMNMQYKVQRITKQFYTDIKRLNPISVITTNGIYLKGEDKGEFFPNIVRIARPIDANSGGGLDMTFFTLRNDQGPVRCEYVFDDLKEELLRKTTDINGKENYTLLADNVAYIKFIKPENDERSIKLECALRKTDKTNEKPDKSKKGKDDIELVNLTVRVESNMIHIKVASQ